MSLDGPRAKTTRSTDEPQADSGVVRRRCGLAQTFAITGATGYLGSHLVRRLHSLGHKVVVLKRSGSNIARIADLVPLMKTYDVDKQSLDSIFEEQQCDCVLHCATEYGRKAVSRASVIEANVSFPLRLLEAAIVHDTRFFVNTDTVLDKSVSDYSLSKHQFRGWLSELSTSICSINISLEHFYGPDDDATKFVGDMVRRVVGGDTCIPLTPGEQLRDFVYIDDVVDAFMVIVDTHMTPKTVCPPESASRGGLICHEVGSGQPVSIRQFMTMLCSIAERKDVMLDFGALPYRPNEAMCSRARIEPLLALGWKPMISLEEGLRRTVRAEQLRLESERTCDT